MKLYEILLEDTSHEDILNNLDTYDFTVPFIKSLKSPSDSIKVQLFIRAVRLMNMYPAPKFGPIKHLMHYKQRMVPEPVFISAILQDPNIAVYIVREEWRFPEWKFTSIEKALLKDPDYVLPNNIITLALTNTQFIKQNFIGYKEFVQRQFADKSILMNKWLRYGENMRSI